MFSKKLTKKLLALGAAAMLALAAAGCGGSDKADAPKEAANGKLTIAINATFPPFESVKEGTHDYVASISILPVISDRNSAKKLPSPT